MQSELAELELEIGQLQGDIDRQNKQQEHLTKLCQDLRTSIYEANTEKVNIDSEIHLIEQSINRLAEEQPIIANEIEMLEQQIRQSVQQEYDSQQKLGELEEVNHQRNEHIRRLEMQISEKNDLITEKTAALTELKVHIGQLVEQQKSTKQQIASLQSQLQHGRASLETARTELLACDDQIRQTERDILNSEAKVSNAQKISTELHQKVNEMLEVQKQTEQTLKEKRAQQAELEQQVHEVQLELSQLAVKDEDLTQRVLDELQIDLAQAYENFNQENVDWQKVQDEITELKAKIERLGNVNVDAIQQQDELEQRYDFLASQVEDLNKSKAQLEQLISKINKESKEKFSTTFEHVRHNFQQIFRKLFGGGKADIFLEDPDNILECGIEIVARPPGKETRSISLLSGGEKTLTALGLLFAVFKTKPSPFCFLDEVDAALDEANNERFNLIVREFQKNSQFIIITHSKRTMSIADMLFGVTMQIQGVSKKISVRFDGIETEADADAAVA
jgi:chromosome segregation protein